MNKNLIIAITAIAGIILLYILLSGSGGKNEEAIITEVKKGNFEVNVTTTGELQAKNSEKIMGPSGLSQAGLWRVKITDLVPEGTIVSEGDYIATLDRTEISTKLKDLASELEKTKSQYLQTKLDTTLELREKRDELVNLKFALEERQIEVKQSKFEPPAIQRQAEIELEKAKRKYDQSLKNYKIKQEQSKAKMTEVGATLAQHQTKYDYLRELVQQFVINAPKKGMVSYERQWGGKKKTVGSSISPWDPVVATLPDLSQMISHTYVNEVDISKIKKGQKVEIGIDAFPNKKFTGQVIEVANVGEELPKTDAKVFEVVIDIQGTDTTLRPSMTTSNKIITNEIENAIFIPLEALHSNDTATYVFKKDGRRITKQEVKTGPSNENQIVILEGLKAQDEIYLSIPDDSKEIKLSSL